MVNHFVKGLLIMFRLLRFEVYILALEGLATNIASIFAQAHILDLLAQILTEVVNQVFLILEAQAMQVWIAHDLHHHDKSTPVVVPESFSFCKAVIFSLILEKFIRHEVEILDFGPVFNKELIECRHSLEFKVPRLGLLVLL